MHRTAGFILTLTAMLYGAGAHAADDSFEQVIDATQPKIVKIYGAGGYRGLEPYQSGLLISAEGHVLTAWSYVLDADYVTVTLNDGRKFEGELLGADPRLEIALLKIDADALPHFRLGEAVEVESGSPVLAFTNLYGVATGNEPASVQHGVVSARTSLDARRGAFETPYRGPVYVLDAMTNNPGAPGGAVTDRHGKLVGVVGKELRDARSNIWLNYAVPVGEMTEAIGDILAGKVRPAATDDQPEPAADPLTLRLLGVALVPDVLPKTPPYVERVEPDSPAAAAGLRPDDLVTFLDDRMINSCKELIEGLSQIDRQQPIKLLVLRDVELIELTLKAQP